MSAKHYRHKKPGRGKRRGQETSSEPPSRQDQGIDMENELFHEDFSDSVLPEDLLTELGISDFSR